MSDELIMDITLSKNKSITISSQANNQNEQLHPQWSMNGSNKHKPIAAMPSQSSDSNGNGGIYNAHIHKAHRHFTLTRGSEALMLCWQNCCISIISITLVEALPRMPHIKFQVNQHRNFKGDSVWKFGLNEIEIN